MESGLVFNIQRYSIQDGPGIRTTVFLKGCPLDCWWCHNPEGQSSQPEIIVVEGRCIRCGQCRKACPNAPQDGGKEGADDKPCTLCGACVSACPTKARQIVGTRMTDAEVLAEILRDRIFYDDSGGGATFSGGEPLLQVGFLKAVLAACRRNGIHTAVDTCGYAPMEHLLGIAPLTDLFLYDLKLMDSGRHLRYTGVANATILDNLRRLGRVHGNIWIRIPVIPGLNDGPDEMEAAAELVSSIGGVRQVNLLAYHETGLQKFTRLGRRYRLDRAATPSPRHLEAVAERFRAQGLNVKTSG
jgi:pyruvate formate lyase activating enzyme